MTAFSRLLTTLAFVAPLFHPTLAARRIDDRSRYDEYKAYLQNYFDEFLKEWAPTSIIDEGAALIIKLPDEEIFEIISSFGYLGRDGMMNMASGSKYVAGIVMLKCLNDNEGLTLDSTVGDVLGWTDSPLKSVTFDMLGAQVSGNTGDITACGLIPYSDNNDCVEELRHSPLNAPPGKEFKYEALGFGFQVANAMCEKVSGKRFKDYFDELKAILEIDNDNMRFGCPRCPTWMIRAGMYDNNPNLGAGLDANADGYSKFMQLLLRKGNWNGQQVISEELVKRMSENDYWPGIIDYMKPCGDGWEGDWPCPESSSGGGDPDAPLPNPWNYGFFSQLWSDADGNFENGLIDPKDPAITEAPIVGHGGAWGAYNWFDWKRGYSASIMMESDIHQSGEAMGVGGALRLAIMDMMDWVLSEDDGGDFIPGDGRRRTEGEMPTEFDFGTLTSVQTCKEHADCGYSTCTNAGYTVPHYCHGEDDWGGVKICMSMYLEPGQCADYRNPNIHTVEYKDLGNGHFCSNGMAVKLCEENPNQDEPEEFDFSTLTSAQPCKEHSDCDYSECTNEGWTFPHYCHGDTEEFKFCMSMYSDPQNCSAALNANIHKVQYKDLGEGLFCSNGVAVSICPAKPETTPAPVEDECSADTKRACNKMDGCEWRMGECMAEGACVGNRKQCNAVEGCRYNSNTKQCEEEPDAPAECADIDSGRTCRQREDCTWVGQNKQGLCISNDDVQPPECSDIESQKKCKGMEGCSWKKKKKVCVAE